VLRPVLPRRRGRIRGGGGREEFKISVLSECHWEKPASITAPSGDGRVGGALGSEDDMPEANYGTLESPWSFWETARAGLDGGAERNRPDNRLLALFIVEWPSPEPVPH